MGFGLTIGECGMVESVRRPLEPPGKEHWWIMDGTGVEAIGMVTERPREVLGSGGSHVRSPKG